MIDIWDIRTYDNDILGYLESNKEIIVGHFEEERAADFRVANLTRWQPQPPNPFAEKFRNAIEELGKIMSAKTVRAFHYSRMTDGEVVEVRANGFVPTSVSFLRERVDRQVAAGRMTIEQANTIVAQSPLQSLEYGDRKGFYMNSMPFDPTSDAVQWLVGYWGGESTYWTFLEDPKMTALLSSIGRGRIIEIALPLANACNGGAGRLAAERAIRAFARQCGCDIGIDSIDLYVEHPLNADTILEVHSEGDDGYQNVSAGIS